MLLLPLFLLLLSGLAVVYRAVVVSRQNSSFGRTPRPPAGLVYKSVLLSVGVGIVEGHLP